MPETIPRRRNLPQHPKHASAKTWAARLGVGAVALIAGAAVAVQTLIQITGSKRPEIAEVLVGGNAQSKLALASGLWRLRISNPKFRGPSRSLAMESLKSEPLSAAALRVVGYSYDFEGQPKRARTYFDLAHKISRRDEMTELWRAADAAKRGDGNTAISALDVMLRTNPSLGTRIFPLFDRLIADPQFRTALAPYVRAHRPWLNPLAETLLAKPENGASLADMFAADPLALNSGLRGSLLGALAVTGDARRLVELYRRFPGTNPHVLTGVSFSADYVDPIYVPVSWQILPSTTVDAGFAKPAGGTQSFEASLQGHASEVILQKLLVLSPGDYRLSTSSNVVQGSPASLSWQLTCRRANSPPVPLASLPLGGGDFTVKADCPILFVGLKVATPDGQGLDVFIEHASLSAH